jgi:hypothetical protein
VRAFFDPRDVFDGDLSFGRVLAGPDSPHADERAPFGDKDATQHRTLTKLHPTGPKLERPISRGRHGLELLEELIGDGRDRAEDQAIDGLLFGP